MSKAFTRESDDAPERPVPTRLATVLPPGGKNLITPGGALRARAELDSLIAEESKLREVAATAPAEVARQLPLLAQRVMKLQHTLQTAVVTGPPVADDGVVRFGATVMVRERSGDEATYRIVGVDETDLDRNWVSWLSPVAKALLNARVGQQVRLKLPGGEEELKILHVSYG